MHFTSAHPGGIKNPVRVFKYVNIDTKGKKETGSAEIDQGLTVTLYSTQ